MKKTDFSKEITEGNTSVFVFSSKETKKGPATKEKLPFYNPTMEQNRDISVVVAQWFLNNSKKHVNICDGLAASGIRGLRFSSELEGDFDVIINDWNEESFKLINKNIEKLKLKNVKATNNNLNTLLSDNSFDYIDIDPFGSPVYFFDSAARSIRNDGMISITATDTAPLCGTYPKVCIRRYGSVPFHSSVMKEVGLRILVGALCKEAAKYDKGIKPILSYSTDHYFRAYIQVINGVDRANDSISNYTVINSGEIKATEQNKKDIGPLWMGELNNKKTIENLRTILFKKKLATKNTIWKLFDLLEEESTAPPFYYTTEKLSSILKKSSPKLETLFDGLIKKGYSVSRTHFSTTGFKTNAPIKEIEKMFK